MDALVLWLRHYHLFSSVRCIEMTEEAIDDHMRHGSIKELSFQERAPGPSDGIFTFEEERRNYPFCVTMMGKAPRYFSSFHEAYSFVRPFALAWTFYLEDMPAHRITTPLIAEEEYS